VVTNNIDVSEQVQILPITSDKETFIEEEEEYLKMQEEKIENEILEVLPSSSKGNEKNENSQFCENSSPENKINLYEVKKNPQKNLSNMNFSSSEDKNYPSQNTKLSSSIKTIKPEESFPMNKESKEKEKLIAESKMTNFKIVSNSEYI